MLFPYVIMQVRLYHQEFALSDLSSLISGYGSKQNFEDVLLL